MDFKKTALILIDLQKGVTSVEVKPHSSGEIIANANKLIKKFRDKGGFIAFVKSSFLDQKDSLEADLKLRAISDVKDGFDDFDDRLDIKEDDYVVIKRGFSGFFGTDLDLELRRHGIENIVFVGISSHIGIDTSARDAYQLNYKIYIIEDAIAAPKQNQHDFVVDEIFPVYGQILKTKDFLNL
ncbi:MAG: cysteine hydrolase [Peptoniphilaceae bacterium]|nr:cysteine hydrolase [Peptoniphilaceae bacterium]MDY6018870.1 cysteine hydrolase [Anaerococcus sp.]